MNQCENIDEEEYTVDLPIEMSPLRSIVLVNSDNFVLENLEPAFDETIEEEPTVVETFQPRVRPQGRAYVCRPCR